MGRSIARPDRWGLAIALVGVLIFSGCGGSEKGGDKKAAEDKKAGGAVGTPVGMVNFSFEPQEVQVSPGTKVTWTNKDSAPHNVQDVSDLNLPISRDLAEGENFSITYDKPGSYPYVCGLHPFMTGTVKVV